MEGLVAECGTWSGASAYALSKSNRVHCFDSFQGFSDGSGKKFAIDIEKVRANLSGSDVVLYQGWIPDVFSMAPEGLYKFVHVDVDQYVPTKAAFDFFMPKLCEGGMIVCDDYNWIGEAQRAVDEAGCFRIKGTQAFYVRALPGPGATPVPF